MPYLYIAPTVILMAVLLVTPIFNVIRYSFYDNAFVKKNPSPVGWLNYQKVLADPVFWQSTRQTVFFVIVSIITHILIALIFAHLLNTSMFKTRTKTIARVVYILPWIFTATVISVMWKLMLQPAGVVNYLLGLVGMATKNTEWFSNKDID